MNEMTAEEAVKQIKENCYFASISEKTKQALDMAINALDQRWIPVSERLPEVDGMYFTTVKGIDVNYIEIRNFANSLYKIDKFDFSDKKGHGWYFYDSDYGIHGYIEETNVIAWMPLPEPYKEGEADDE